LQPVDGVGHPRAVAVLADALAWAAREPGAGHAEPRWILLDADLDWRTRLAALRAGVRHFVSAPLTRGALLRTLRSAGIEPGAPRPGVLVAGGLPAAERGFGLMARAGAWVLRATSVDLLFELLRAQMPDVVVLRDGVDGATPHELMRLIRADAGFDSVMLLAVLERAEDAHELPAGASFLLEPVSAQGLCDAVFDRWRRRRRLQAAEASLQRVLALQEQERAALDAHALVSISDSAGTIVYANDQFCRASGWSREELIGRNHRVAKSGVHSPQVYAGLWATISRGGVWQGELCNRRKDGSTYWVATTIMPLGAQAGPRPTQYLAIRTDITAQKEAQFALARQLERLEQMSRLAGVGSWDYEVASGRLHCSRQAERILGCDPGVEFGCADVLRCFDGAEARQRVRRACVAALAEGVPFDLEVPLLTLRRERRWVRLLAAAHGQGAGVDRLSGAVQDVTEARQARQALQQARDDADRANRAKSAFVSTMSHELRTPLNAVLGFGQLLELDLPAGTPAHRQVQEILRGGRHLLALIDDILDLARIESGRVDLAIEAVVVAEVVEDCLRLVQPLAAARGIAVTVDVAAGLVARADRLRLRQVLMNLLSNAIKYNVDGGLVEVRAGADAARVRVAVRDSGCGIAPQRLGELFQPFNRLGAERGPVEGTGIGLVIARELVERMGGAIGVDSVAGAGSTFWIELPGGACAGVLAELEGGPPPAQGG
jgi:PAS domain S-box-containing protein